MYGKRVDFLSAGLVCQCLKIGLIWNFYGQMTALMPALPVAIEGVSRAARCNAKNEYVRFPARR